MENNLLTIPVIAKICNVKHKVVLDWILNEQLPSLRTPGKHSRIKKDDFVRFLEMKNFDIPELLKENKNSIKILVAGKGKKLYEQLRSKSDEITSLNIFYSSFFVVSKFVRVKPDILILCLNKNNLNKLSMLDEIKKMIKNLRKIILISYNLTEKQTKDIIFPEYIHSYYKDPVDTDSLLKNVI